MAEYKSSAEHHEHLERVETRATYISSHAATHLPEEHRRYLLSRHGTLELDPMPGFGDADPYNWPQWKVRGKAAAPHRLATADELQKLSNLLLVAFHALMSTFTASAIIPAYESIAQDLGVSIQRASYLTSLQIAILGAAPFLWRPLSSRFGRRPVFLSTLLGSLVANIGCANSPGYGSMAACRALVALFISPAGGIGSGVVTETFFKKDRARYLGLWTLLVTLGVPLSPLLMGFVAVRVAYRWIYYILAITNAVQFVLYLFLGPETRYPRKGVEYEGSSFWQEYLGFFRRIDPAPLTVSEFFRPLLLFASAPVLVAACAYAMTFLFGSVMITVEIPQLFAEKFHFDAQQLGLQFVGIIIGAVLGEQLGGFCSDWWMERRAAKTGRAPRPEHRLWLSYIGFPVAIMGCVVFLVQTAKAPDGRWNVTPVVGAAFAAGGNQVVTTVLVTYAVDSTPEDAAGVGVFITLVRQTWAFIGPFWLPQMFARVGLEGSAGIVAALMAACSIAPVVVLHAVRRSREGMPTSSASGSESA